MEGFGVFAGEDHFFGTESVGDSVVGYGFLSRWGRGAGAVLGRVVCGGGLFFSCHYLHSDGKFGMADGGGWWVCLSMCLVSMG